LPVLEDADSIQMGLVEVMRLIVTQQIDHKAAGVVAVCAADGVGQFEADFV
jgi:hypothetical protein